MPRKSRTIQLSVFKQDPPALEKIERDPQPIFYSIRQEIKKLPWHLRDVVECRFGFNGQDETLDEIACRWRITRQAVHGRERSALKKLRATLKYVISQQE